MLGLNSNTHDFSKNLKSNSCPTFNNQSSLVVQSAANKNLLLTDETQDYNKMIEQFKLVLLESNIEEIRSFLLNTSLVSAEKVNQFSSDIKFYEFIANTICSKENTERFPELEYCYLIVDEEVAKLGGDTYSLSENHYIGFDE